MHQPQDIYPAWQADEETYILDVNGHIYTSSITIQEFETNQNNRGAVLKGEQNDKYATNAYNIKRCTILNNGKTLQLFAADQILTFGMHKPTYALLSANSQKIAEIIQQNSMTFQEFKVLFECLAPDIQQDIKNMDSRLPTHFGHPPLLNLWLKYNGNLTTQDISWLIEQDFNINSRSPVSGVSFFTSLNWWATLNLNQDHTSAALKATSILKHLLNEPKLDPHSVIAECQYTLARFQHLIPDSHNTFASSISQLEKRILLNGQNISQQIERKYKRL